MATGSCLDVCGTGIRLITSRWMGGSVSREDSTRSTLVDEKSKWIDTAEVTGLLKSLSRVRSIMHYIYDFITYHTIHMFLILISTIISIVRSYM